MRLWEAEGPVNPLILLTREIATDERVGHWRMTEADSTCLTRPQRRLLRRIFNGRIDPIAADGRSFLSYKDASRYLEGLSPDARDVAYAELKANAQKAP